MLGFGRGEKVTGTEEPLEQGAPSISPTAVRDQLERVLSADGFKRSPRMAGFLRFVVSETLAGNADRLKEYVIAVGVFGRDTSFDPNTSAVVRVEASRLRHRLQEYFLGPGCDDPIEIALPPGSYVPGFKSRSGHEALGPGSKAPLALPDKPSIAVLPFTNIGEDTKQDYFADGIAEDLITALSRIRWMFVTARNSTFAYKGQSPDVRRVGQELGVRYVLEGSVRKGGNRVRISAQLIDATIGNHVWADRYDRDLAELFDLQDEITDAIAAAIEPAIGEAERDRAKRKPPDNLDAWESYQRGLWHMYQFSAEDNVAAKDFFTRAIDLDGQFAPPHGALAYTLFIDVHLGFAPSREDTIATAIARGREGIAVDDKDPMSHFGLGRVLMMAGKYEAALTELEIAVDLNPNFALAHLGLGTARDAIGRSHDAIKSLDTAIRLSPHDPILWTMENARAAVRIELGDFEQAVDDARLACRHPNTGYWSYLSLASALAHLDRLDEARAALDNVYRLNPKFSWRTVVANAAYSKMAEPGSNFGVGLRKAGLDVPQ
jgi:TolB-like protein/cytochrome c-type biogenesis protein CcmH/NrfG